MEMRLAGKPRIPIIGRLYSTKTANTGTHDPDQ
jgi:hypothetical protein